MATEDVKKASEVIHEHAPKQRVEISLSEAEWEAILKHLDKYNPDEAAEFEFVVKNEPMMNIRLAAYSYGKRKCCAELQSKRSKE
ncbi:MAG: hypothetical protein K2X29_08355 [Candidatus Obscuribacterales bacterium]|nr:hypothetical protein [Candidatus Obscuribacterales bacterium]